MAGTVSAIRRRLSRLPRAGLVCALIATANAGCWAVITPSFWVPDEPPHVGYVQQLAEAGQLPALPRTFTELTGLAGEQSFVYGNLPFSVEGRPTWSEAADERIQRTLDSGELDRVRSGQAAYIANNPPLYYLIQSVPYRAFHEANFLDRLFAMRLFSALFAGLTVFFTFLFLRELLPRTEWAASVGALVVAFQPVLGFISGGVNNDSLVWAASAAVFYGVAHAFRRGLNARTGALIGVALAVGFLTKPTIAGLLPGTLVGFAALLWRAAPGGRRRAALGAASALGIGLLPSTVWILGAKLGLLGTSDPSAALASGSAGDTGSTLAARTSYIWQALLPRLPFMTDLIPWYTPWETFFKGFIGRFGWFQYGFPEPWYRVALGVFMVIAGLAGWALAKGRRALRGRALEALTYGAMALGFVLALEMVAFGYNRNLKIAYFEQARYLFPLLPLYGALIALAVKGAGRRWGPAVGAFLVVLAMGHSLFSQLITISRFYA